MNLLKMIAATTLLFLVGCSDVDLPDCNSDPIPIPENFSATSYWILNSDLQSVFALEDSLELARHYCLHGGAEGRPFLGDPESISSSSLIILSSSSAKLSSSSKPLSSSQISSSSAPPIHCVLNWFTESMFRSYFPNRHSNYTWTAFKQALEMVPNFICGSAGSDQKRQKQELAAVFAHWRQEVADLKYIEEICGTQGTCLNNYNTDWSNGSWPAVPGKSYHGRGAKQISWPGNYGEASLFLFGNKNVLLSNPERVMNEGKLAFATSFWFWSARGCGAGFWNTGFGATTEIINGNYECGASYGQNAQLREQYYGQFLLTLGVSDSRSKSVGCANQW